MAQFGRGQILKIVCGDPLELNTTASPRDYVAIRLLNSHAVFAGCRRFWLLGNESLHLICDLVEEPNGGGCG
jgi:hypothetical protein